MLVEFVSSLILTASPTVDWYLRSEVRAATTGEYDAQLNPAVRLRIPVGQFSFLAAYTPRILLFEPNVPQKVSVLHAAQLAAELRTGKTGRIFLAEDLSYGDQSFSWLVTGADGGIPNLTSLAQLPIIKYANATTTLGIEQALSRKVGIAISGGYTISGGANTAAQQALPLSHGPSASIRVASAVGTRDALVLRLVGYATFFSGTPSTVAQGSTIGSLGTQSYVADVGAGWQHRFSKTTDGEILMGAGGTSYVTPVLIENQLFPYFIAAIRKKFLETQYQSIWGGLTFRVTPIIDPITGIIYEQADMYALLNYSPKPKLTFSFTVGGSVSLSTQVHQNLGLVGAVVTYQLTHEVGLSAGVRAFSFPSIYSRPLAPVPGPNRYQVQALGFLAVTLNERTRL